MEASREIITKKIDEVINRYQYFHYICFMFMFAKAVPKQARKGAWFEKYTDFPGAKLSVIH